MSTSKEDIAVALRQVNERVEGLRPQIEEKANQVLPEGSWTVRDALCHVAARASSVKMIVDRYESGSGGGSGGGPRPDIHAINQGQIDDRHDRSIEQLLGEITGGRLEAVESLGEIDDALLERLVPNFRGDGEMPIGEMVLRASAGHDNAHLDEIEAALNG